MNAILMEAPVSVIIPCYNGGDVIERAIQSVYGQTWRPAELIVVDDGSNDETVMKLRKLKERYGNWLKLIELEKNSGGPSLPRNIGLENATQPYIAFLDHDDAWHPQKIEIQLKFMTEHPEFVLSGHKIRAVKNNEIDFELPKEFSFREISSAELTLRNVFITSTVMMRADVPFRFDEKLVGTEDYLMWLSIVFSGFKVALLDIPLAFLFKGYNYESELSLSGNLWKMEKGEMQVYVKLMKEGKIGRLSTYFLLLFSFLKYLRRVLIRIWRRHLKK